MIHFKHPVGTLMSEPPPAPKPKSITYTEEEVRNLVYRAHIYGINFGICKEEDEDKYLVSKFWEQNKKK